MGIWPRTQMQKKKGCLVVFSRALAKSMCHLLKLWMLRKLQDESQSPGLPFSLDALCLHQPSQISLGGLYPASTQNKGLNPSNDFCTPWIMSIETTRTPFFMSSIHRQGQTWLCPAGRVALPLR
jgi:hypothetical protein